MRVPTDLTNTPRVYEFIFFHLNLQVVAFLELNTLRKGHIILHFVLKGGPLFLNHLSGFGDLN